MRAREFSSTFLGRLLVLPCRSRSVALRLLTPCLVLLIVGPAPAEEAVYSMVGGDQPVAASGAWTDEDTYVAKLCLHRTPFCATLGLEFAGDILLFDQEMNVGFGPTKRPQLVGRLAE